MNKFVSPSAAKGWSGDAMVLSKPPASSRPTIWNTVGQGPTALAVGTHGGYLDIFFYLFGHFYSHLGIESILTFLSLGLTAH